MKAMLLAAGHGTRFRPYTDKLAKPAISFLNLPLLAFPLYQLEGLGITDTIINTHHLPDTIHRAVAPLSEWLNMNIHFSHEAPNILNSGGGIKNVAPFFADQQNFIVANADTLILFKEQGLTEFCNFHQQQQALATLLVCSHPGVGVQFGGVWVEAQSSQVISIGKQAPPQPSQALHYAGYLMLHQRIFSFIPDSESPHIFTDVLLPAIAQGEKVLAYNMNMEWFETGDLQSYTQAADGLYQRYLAQPNDKSLQSLIATFDFFATNIIPTPP
ncbi:MAG: NTP transferase domain-containing protein [Bdellovibrionales bacterium]|nr:NTP transferase domain-containing protein [Bdellovibrionales bacterium]